MRPVSGPLVHADGAARKAGGLHLGFARRSLTSSTASPRPLLRTGFLALVILLRQRGAVLARAGRGHMNHRGRRRLLLCRCGRRSPPPTPGPRARRHWGRRAAGRSRNWIGEKIWKPWRRRASLKTVWRARDRNFFLMG
jgi:hypothetical protein